jgi:hypothetical protein
MPLPFKRRQYFPLNLWRPTPTSPHKAEDENMQRLNYAVFGVGIKIGLSPSWEESLIYQGAEESIGNYDDCGDVQCLLMRFLIIFYVIYLV